MNDREINYSIALSIMAFVIFKKFLSNRGFFAVTTTVFREAVKFLLKTSPSAPLPLRYRCWSLPFDSGEMSDGTENFKREFGINLLKKSVHLWINLHKFQVTIELVTSCMVFNFKSLIKQQPTLSSFFFFLSFLF